MYCAKCEELMIDDKPITDEVGYDWNYDVQVCEECRPKDVMGDEELRLFLGIDKEFWNDDA